MAAMRQGAIYPWGIRVQAAGLQVAQAPPFGPRSTPPLASPSAPPSAPPSPTPSPTPSVPPSAPALATSWVASSDSFFLPTDAAVPSHPTVHHGLVDKLVDIHNIVEIQDGRLHNMPGAQAVRFDATALLHKHRGAPWLVSGGFAHRGQEAMACQAVWGFVLCDADGAPPAWPAWPALAQWLASLDDAHNPCPASGRLACVLDVGHTGLRLRATQLQALPCLDANGHPHLVLALAGEPVFPNAGAWRIDSAASNSPPAAAANPWAPSVRVFQPQGRRLWHVAAGQGPLVWPAATGKATDMGLGRAHGLAFVQNLGVHEIHFPHPRLEAMVVNSLGEYGRLCFAPQAVLAWQALPGGSPAKDTSGTSVGASHSARLGPTDRISLGVDGWHFRKTWGLDSGHIDELFSFGDTRLVLRGVDAQVAFAFDDGHWTSRQGPLRFELQTGGSCLLALTAESLQAGTYLAAHLSGTAWHWGDATRDLGKLLPRLLDSLQADGGHAAGELECERAQPSGRRLRIEGADGQWRLRDAFALPGLRSGFGTAHHVRASVGARVAQAPGQAWFGIELGSAVDPMTWVLTPFVGTASLRLGMGLDAAENEPCGDGSRGPSMPLHGDLRISMPLRLALQSSAWVGAHGATDTGCADVIARIQSHTPVNTHTTAPWQVTVQGPCSAQLLGGLVSTSLCLETVAQLLPDVPDAQHVSLVAHMGVGLHLAVAWLLDIDFDTDWAWATCLSREP